MKRKLIALAMALCLCVSAFPFTALAGEESLPKEPYTVRTVQDLLDLAGLCRLDSWSRDRTVLLEADLDLSDSGFTGIPVFAGTFDGGGHTVTGFNLKADGSVQGFFRYLQQEAAVTGLNLKGSVTPAGTRSTVGALAGSNAGTIRSCTFAGVVTGAERVGGLVGVNRTTGLIENCTVSGVVYGSHFVGGAAGENHGVIRCCSNDGGVNTTPGQNAVSLSELTLDSVLTTETVTDATDIGGITGVNSGVVRGCVNRGTVGYQHIGYNVGGIAGSQTGTIEGCVNYGTVSARKEAGGIAGQMEPSSTIQYRTDQLQVLQGQLNTLQALTDKAAADAEALGSEMTSRLNSLQNQVNSANSAVRALLEQSAAGLTVGTTTITTDLSDLLPDSEAEESAPEPEPGTPHERPARRQPDRTLTIEVPSVELSNQDAIAAARNDLSSSITGIVDSVGSLGSSSPTVLVDDIRAITAQLNRIGQTVGALAAGENTDVILDVSDEDTGNDTAGKVYNCVNRGTIRADINAGGITGAMAAENDLDPEDDLTVSGSESLNVTLKNRAVVRDCRNEGTVTARRQGAGGIAGTMEMGSVRSCINVGAVGADGVREVGGIAGASRGILRDCSAKCTLTGGSRVGGIAGTGSVITGCRAMVRIVGGTEQLGAVAGALNDESALARLGLEEETDLQDNYFVPNDTAPGGVDGVSYAGAAEPLNCAEPTVLEGLPDEFRTMTLRFTAENSADTVLSVAYGGAVDPADIPEPPVREGFTAVWEGLEDIDLDCVTFDAVVTAVYTPLTTTRRSGLQRDDGRPVLLAEGSFSTDEPLELTVTEPPALAAGDTAEGSWRLSLPGGTARTLRYLPETSKTTELWLHGAEGWRRAEAEADGSYLVFTMQPGDDAFAAVRPAPSRLPLMLGLGGAAVLLLTLALRGKGKNRVRENESMGEKTRE